MEKDMTTARRSESGFTLVEALVAIVVLVFGIIAVTNLMIVAASSNSVANQSTGATTSASERMEVLRTMQYTVLSAAAGGDLDSNVGPTVPCNPAAGGPVPLPPATYNCVDDIPGLGQVLTRWQVVVVAPRMLSIRVRSEGLGALARARSRAEFTTLRSCTDSQPNTVPINMECPQ
jgi:type II secretory pathway pseudopilin PulG